MFLVVTPLILLLPGRADGASAGPGRAGGLKPSRVACSRVNGARAGPAIIVAFLEASTSA